MAEPGLRVLLADDDPLSREFLADALEAAGAEVLAVDDGQAAVKQLRRGSFDLVLTDLRMPRKDGMAVLRAAKAVDRSLPVVLVTAHGTVDVAVHALREGVDDVLVKPVQCEQIRLLLERLRKRSLLLAENEYLRRGDDECEAFPSRNPRMRAIDELIDKLGGTSSTVLITGESGVGKEVLAAELHRRLDPAGAPFIKLNCAAIPGTLIESELFGHEAGAFTGATGARPGRFELADGGTLLLDEIGEVSLPLQAKLLRVLEDGVVQRVGGTGETRVRVRVLAATNRDLDAEVRRGHFRQDLFYRLNVVPIRIPPLRERPEDLIPLAEHFLARLAAQRGASPPRFDARARSALLAYDWPGNVRELRNLVQRAFLLGEGDEIPAALIEPWLGGEPAGDDLGRWRPAGDPVDLLVGRRLREVEDALILATLEREGGNRTRAAAVLGVSPRTLYNRLQQLAPAAG